MEACHRHALATLPYLSDKDRQTAWDQAALALTELHRGLLPYEVDPEKDRLDRQSAEQRMKSGWEERWGAMDDPETQERIRRTVEHLRSQRAR